MAITGVAEYLAAAQAERGNGGAEGSNRGQDGDPGSFGGTAAPQSARPASTSTWVTV